MIRRLLIANRGEIAVRIAATARRLGIATVAVHSEADTAALHVRSADAAVAIGPAPAAESYLRIDALLAAARASGADAIHPGYGFLSENAAFAEAVLAEGLVWVGPPPEAIRAMGRKDNAKRLMEAAGVPVTPGYHGAAQDDATLAGEAGRIGYPVLIKAVAGGGGKGMRRVDAAAAFADALARARSEAEASFGDGRVLIERFVPQPRHIEVQVFADRHGSVVHLWERDCSLQRRHQKVIEEAPAPGMTPELRAAMTDAAVRAAAAVGYEGAGTVEFIVDGARMTPDAFYFMEMNTRLQVEHPVTEAVTGLDLVEWQIRVAEGAPLPLAQEAIALTGHAIEARVYAEDPSEDFAPRTGRVTGLALAEGARCDPGVAAGDRVTPHYDPMIAKLIAHGPDRPAALARLAEALAATDVAGVTTNLDFLARLISEPEVQTGRLDTGLIGRRIAALTGPLVPTAAQAAAAAAVVSGLAARADDAFAGWRAWGTGWSHVDLAGPDGSACPVALAPGADGTIAAQTPVGTCHIALRPLGGPQWQLSAEGHGGRIWLHHHGNRVVLADRGLRLAFSRTDPLAQAAADPTGGDTVVAPLPGILRRVEVAPGARVEAGAVLAVIEAMKMEHTLSAPRDAVVAEVLAAAGDSVAEGAVLIALEPADD